MILSNFYIFIVKNNIFIETFKLVDNIGILYFSTLGGILYA